jgi:hypothetical protein
MNYLSGARRAKLMLLIEGIAGHHAVAINAFNYLVGQEIHAFGPKGKGLWGSNDTVVTYVIRNTQVGYMDLEEKFFTLNIYLNKYNSNKYGLIYTDNVFEREIKKMIPEFHVSFSEQGMQGENYVNLDVDYKK